MWDGDRLTVWAGTQRPFGIRTELAQRFGLDESSVRVIAPEIGGGFGSKSPYHVAHEAARLARIAGRPVRVAYTRAEDMTHATMRPAAVTAGSSPGSVTHITPATARSSAAAGLTRRTTLPTFK
jgi:isoquinoline 1-oxidoreductase